MNKFISAFIFLILTSSRLLFAQYYVTGQDPASLKWKQIETPHFRLLFPESFTLRANSYANLLEESFVNAQTLYPSIRGRMPVIVHNYSLLSNGYVAWAPKRIELFPFPGQSNLPDDPSRLLIMHEMTHVGQISSLRKGDTRFFYYLFGEQAVGVVSSMLPEWSLEGDAVFSETRFSNSGRGRSISFLQEEKSICLDQKKIYPYSKMLFGSYRNETPDEYVYGFIIMNYLRSRYPDFWKENVDFTGRNSLFIIPSNIYMKQKLHLSRNSLYMAATDSARSYWAKEKNEYTAVRYHSEVPERKSGYADYFSPFLTSGGKIIALKTSLSTPERFVLIDTLQKRESNLGTTGYIYPSVFSFSNGKMVWAETQPDKRWGNRSFSAIKMMDINSGKVRTITSFTRLSAPSLSHNGSSIVAVNSAPDLSSSLIFIDTISGSIKNEIAAPGGVFLERPVWSENDSSVAVITLSSAGEGVAVYNTETSVWSYPVRMSHTDIEQVGFSGNQLYLLMQDAHSVNIYARSSAGEFFQVTHSEYGISSFSLSGNKLTFSDYSKDGFNVSVISTDSLDINAEPLSENSLFAPNDIKSLSTTTDTTVYKATPYRRFGHTISIHSWAPLYYNAENIVAGDVSISPGFTLLSQNDLSTVISSFGYEHQKNIDIFHTSVTLQGQYPIITFGARYGNGVLYELFDKANAIHSRSYYANMTVPLLYNYSKFRQYLAAAISINHTDDYYNTYDNKFFNSKYTTISPRVYFYNLFQTAARDIYPRWGQVIDMRASFVPGGSDRYSPLKGFTATFFFPGLFRNHSLMLTAGYENQKPVKTSIFNNINTFPRGFDGLVSAELEKISADYTFPIWYPDLSAGRFLYLKRIRGDVFYDQSISYGTYEEKYHYFYEPKEVLKSTGGEFLMDFYLLRIPYEISSGVRGGYRIYSGTVFMQFVLSVNIYGSTLGRKR